MPCSGSFSMGANFCGFHGPTCFFSNKQTRVEIDDVIWRAYVNTNKYPCFFASLFFRVARFSCGVWTSTGRSVVWALHKNNNMKNSSKVSGHWNLCILKNFPLYGTRDVGHGWPLLILITGVITNWSLILHNKSFFNLFYDWTRLWNLDLKSGTPLSKSQESFWHGPQAF